MEITWFGHANFMIKTAMATALIDPFFIGNPSAPATHDSIEHADLILVTHDHNDHVGQTLEIAKRTGAEVVGAFETINSLIAQGLHESQGVPMNIGGTVERYGIAAKMVQAMHSSVTGPAAGYILTIGDFCIYHSGDTGIFMDMELFSRFHDFDLAILPIGGRFTMDAEQAAVACSMVKCKKVVPMHWGTWPILEKNTEKFAEQLKKHAPETELVILEPGKPHAF